MTWIKRTVRADGSIALGIREGWSDEAAAEVAKGDFDILLIQTGQWSDFNFLEPYANNIARLSISSPVDTFRGVEKLMNLRELDLADAPSPSLDLMVFQNLESCHLHWHKGYSPRFFGLPKLSQVAISHYSARTCEDIAQAKQLSTLDLRQGSVQSLKGLETLPKLKQLSLAYMRNLSDVSAVAGLKGLEVLHIEKCPKVVDIDFVRSLPNIRKLFLDCGSPGFADLEWMRKLVDLIDVLIAVPVQTIDWDVIFSLPELQRVVINTHPGYAISDEELFAQARAHGRQLDNYVRAGTRKHPAFKFWMERKDPKSLVSG